MQNFRLAHAGSCHLFERTCVSTESREGLVCRFHLAVANRSSSAGEYQYAVRFAISQWLEKHGVDHREHCCVASDSQYDGEDDGCGEQRVLPHGPQCVTDVPPQRFEKSAFTHWNF